MVGLELEIGIDWVGLLILLVLCDTASGFLGLADNGSRQSDMLLVMTSSYACVVRCKQCSDALWIQYRGTRGCRLSSEKQY
jgi:hypothetical protein